MTLMKLFGRRIEFEDDEYLTVKHQEMSQLSNP